MDLPDTYRRPRAAATIGRLGLLLLTAALFLTALLLSACGGATEIEPAVLPPPVAEAGNQPALGPAPLPSPAPTLSPPATPTPSATGDAPAPATAAVEATRTAAANPPTPPVTANPPDVAQAVSLPAAPTEPLPTPSGVYSWTLKVPILMYHYVSAPPADADVYRTDLSVTPEMFRQQMAYLAEHGYTAIDLYDLTQAIVGYVELPEKPVVLTFDDGYLDNYEVAFPILQEFGHRGTFFIITEFIDRGREGYMTWPMIEELARAGHRVESHSRNHPDLAGKPHDVLVWQVLGAQETLAAHVGYRPRYFCYPGGAYDEATIQMLRDLDYWGAVTTASGTWHGFNDRYEWTRIRIRNDTTMDEFAKLLDPEGTVGGRVSDQ